jgi:ligand-binding sensor domain-containing protein
MKFSIGIKVSILIFIINLITNTVTSQIVKNISNFRYFEYKDGLSENDVKEFIADKENGYWFRTSGSIIFFNGYEFTNYNKENNLFHIHNKKIFTFNSFRNHIYVFGKEGIDIINLKTKDFVHYVKISQYDFPNIFITNSWPNEFFDNSSVEDIASWLQKSFEISHRLVS